MALEASGEMSLGGTTVGRSVNCELGCLGTDAICMDRADVRSLAGVASGAIAMSESQQMENLLSKMLFQIMILNGKN